MQVKGPFVTADLCSHRPRTRILANITINLTGQSIGLSLYFQKESMIIKHDIYILQHHYTGITILSWKDIAM